MQQHCHHSLDDFTSCPSHFPGPGRHSPGPDCGMAVRLLCSVALYLLGAGESQMQNSLKSKRNIFLCARFASGFSIKAHLGLCDQFLSFSLRLLGCWYLPDPKILCDRDGKEDYSRMFSNYGPWQHVLVSARPRNGTAADPLFIRGKYHGERRALFRISKEHFPLTLETANSSQTSSYFCASGDNTGPHRLHKKAVTKAKKSHLLKPHLKLRKLLQISQTPQPWGACVAWATIWPESDSWVSVSKAGEGPSQSGLTFLLPLTTLPSETWINCVPQDKWDINLIVA